MRRLVKKIRNKILAPIIQQLNDISADINVVETNLFDLKRDISSHYLLSNLSIKFQLETKHPIAIKSDDHKFPKGTANDDTRCPRFIKKCEDILGKKLKVLDIGCAGGGLVYDFISRGHEAVGLEGSDFSQKRNRAHWKVLPNHLFTCDVTKDFVFSNINNNKPVKFDLICAWEVLEHIPEQDISALFENIRKNLSKDGIFCASVATFEHCDPVTGAIWHVTVKDKSWWIEKLKQNSMELVDVGFEDKDYPRGAGNLYGGDWDVTINPHLGFHIVVKVKQSIEAPRQK